MNNIKLEKTIEALIYHKIVVFVEGYFVVVATIVYSQGNVLCSSTLASFSGVTIPRGENCKFYATYIRYLINRQRFFIFFLD